MTFTANRNEQGLARRDFLRVAGISGLVSFFLHMTGLPHPLSVGRMP
jgi:hypothetical protein